MNQWQNAGNDITDHYSIDDKRTLCGKKIGKLYKAGLKEVQKNSWVKINGKNSNPICKTCLKIINHFPN